MMKSKNEIKTKKMDNRDGREKDSVRKRTSKMEKGEKEGELR